NNLTDDDCDLVTDESITVTSVWPDDGIYHGGTTVTLTGSGLAGVASVTLGGTEVENLDVEDDTTIEVITAAGTIGSVEIELSDAWGSYVVSDPFTFTGLADGLGTAELTDASGDTTIGAPTDVLPDGSPGPPVDPIEQTVSIGAETDYYYALVTIAGVTDAAAEDPGLQAEIGYGFQGMSPFPDAPTGSGSYVDSWTWHPAEFDAVSPYNAGTQPSDLYRGTLTASSYGSFLVSFRFSVDGGLNWLYADSDPLAVALQPDLMWFLHVVPPVP
ncbi:MAG TPA: hypothetical protein DIU15_01320, partial [Deltaproteobacteria bacterium]|nr:hypothetical protein [Deltaproteobacteria bacterium]